MSFISRCAQLTRDLKELGMLDPEKDKASFIFLEDEGFSYLISLGVNGPYQSSCDERFGELEIAFFQEFPELKLLTKVYKEKIDNLILFECNYK